jgi:hypothetical protein
MEPLNGRCGTLFPAKSLKRQIARASQDILGLSFIPTNQEVGSSNLSGRTILFGSIPDR